MITMGIQKLDDLAGFKAGIGVGELFRIAIKSLHRDTSCGRRSLQETSVKNSFFEGVKPTTGVNFVDRAPRMAV
jgi:hypothetical protein